MYNIIVTGFGQIPHDAYNPSWDVVKELPDNIGGIKINKYYLDVTWDVKDKIKDIIDKTQNIACVLSVGMDSSLTAIRIEEFASNRRGPIEDVTGNQPETNRVFEYISDIVTIDAAAYLYNNISFNELVSITKKKIGDDKVIRGDIYSAGDYICNSCYYSAIYNSYNGDVVGYPQYYAQFVHIPTNKDITTEELRSYVLAHLNTLIDNLAVLHQ